MNRDRIIVMPYSYIDNAPNRIIRNMVSILQENYEIVGQMSPSMNPIAMMKTKAIILNWSEQNITEEQKKQILRYKEYGTKIIWFFHNRVAHESQNVEKESANMIWLADNSDYIAVLSKTSKKYVPGKKTNLDKVRYVPHITYNSQKSERIMQVLKRKYNIKEDDFVYCIYGGIRPYKNIETAINCFNHICNNKMKLIIAGKPLTKEYGSEIKKIADSNINILTELRNLSEIELDSIIGISDVILLAHTGLSCMNSGVLIKAFCEGKTVVTPEICMVKDIPMQEDFFYRYNQENVLMLEKQMIKAYSDGKIIVKEKGDKAKRYIYTWNGEDKVREALDFMLKEESSWENMKCTSRDRQLFNLEELVRHNNEELQKYNYLFKTACQWVRLNNENHDVSDWINKRDWKKVAIYGMGELGTVLLEDLRKKGILVEYGIDREKGKVCGDIPIYTVDEMPETVDGIIVTAITYYDEISRRINSKCKIPVVSLKDVLDEVDCLYKLGD